MNAVALGPPLPGTPTSVAKVVAFLVGPEGHWVNGQVIGADSDT